MRLRLVVGYRRLGQSVAPIFKGQALQEECLEQVDTLLYKGLCGQWVGSRENKESNQIAGAWSFYQHVGGKMKKSGSEGISCSEKSVTNHEPTPRNVPAERRPPLHRGVNLKSHVCQFYPPLISHGLPWRRIWSTAISNQILKGPRHSTARLCHKCTVLLILLLSVILTVSMILYSDWRRSTPCIQHKW